MNKYFVLDTNVLLHNAGCIDSFADNVVVLPMAVIEELDTFKSQNDELGRNARLVIRKLDRLRTKGKLGDGVPMSNGGILKIMRSQMGNGDMGLNAETPDNHIIRVAYDLLKKSERVIFVSKDINARLKADALGIEVRDFEKQKVKIDEMFTGFREIKVSSTVIEKFHAEKKLHLNAHHQPIYPNEFIVLVDQENDKHSVLTRAKENSDLVELNPDYGNIWQLKPRSREQRMVLELLMDDSISIVTLVGQAGTGKTLLALAAGLEKTLKHKVYDKMLVSRPIMPLGKDLGYLPGDKDEKLINWMHPIFDNLSYLMRYSGDMKGTVREKIEKLQKDHVVELEALTYIRGRSISQQYVIIDEAQNLTPHEIKTIVSRAGEGTKMVLTGDPYQIDNPYLDMSSNGLSYAVERLKDQAIHGHVTLKKSERSMLAAVAADRL
jgi:PhoH-like ATPase